MRTFLYTTLIVLIGLTSCRSIDKLVDEGRYDDAILLATKKLAGKKNKKTKHIQALEEAFFKVNSIETDRIALDAVSTIHLNNFYISPEREIINNIIERRQLETLVDKVDRRGQVIRDTSGQIVQEIRIENIVARIQEIIRTKEMSMKGFVETTDYETGLRLDYKPWASTVNFASDACTFRGDRRALGDNTRKRVNQNLELFPSDYTMIEGGLIAGREDIFRHLRNIDFDNYLRESYLSNR